MSVPWSLEVKDYRLNNPHWFSISVGRFRGYRHARESALDLLELEGDVVYRLTPVPEEFYENWQASNECEELVGTADIGEWV